LSLTFSPIFYLNISKASSQMKLASVGTPDFLTSRSTINFSFLPN
jgi:hypothetical protein